MNTKTRKGLVEDKELYLSVSGVGYSKEELYEIIDKFDIDTPEGSSGAIKALQSYMNSSEYDAVDVLGKLTLFGSRKGSRKGYTTVDGKSPMEYIKMLYDLQGFPSQQDVISHGSETDAEEYLKNNASFFGTEYEKYLRMIAEEYEEGMREGSRKGSCGHCERPENLSNISSSIVSGMNRKIGEPSRKGAPAFATGNSGKLMNDFKNVLNNEKVSTKLQKTFGTKDQRNQAILKEHKNKQEKIDRQNKVDQLHK